MHSCAVAHAAAEVRRLWMSTRKIYWIGSHVCAALFMIAISESFGVVDSYQGSKLCKPHFECGLGERRRSA